MSNSIEENQKYYQGRSGNLNDFLSKMNLMVGEGSKFFVTLQSVYLYRNNISHSSHNNYFSLQKNKFKEMAASLLFNVVLRQGGSVLSNNMQKNFSAKDLIEFGFNPNIILSKLSGEQKLKSHAQLKIKINKLKKKYNKLSYSSMFCCKKRSPLSKTTTFNELYERTNINRHMHMDLNQLIKIKTKIINSNISTYIKLTRSKNIILTKKDLSKKMFFFHNCYFHSNSVVQNKKNLISF